jgi:GST-like protein
MLSRLMFVASGIGPYSGQAVHFKRYAPGPMPYALCPMPYAIERYNFEAWRH